MAETEITYVGRSTEYGECEPVEVAVPTGFHEEANTSQVGFSDDGKLFLTDLESGRLHEDDSIVLGAVSGKINPNPGACGVGILMFIVGALIQFEAYILAPANMVRLAIRQDRISLHHLTYNLETVADEERAVLIFSALNFTNTLKELSQPVSRRFVLEGIRDTHRIFWTPTGLKKLAKLTRDYCGDPGGGLREFVRDLRTLPRQEPLPQATRTRLEDRKPAPLEAPDPRATAVWAAALAAAAALIKSLDLAVGVATGILLIGPQGSLVVAGDPFKT